MKRSTPFLALALAAAVTSPAFAQSDAPAVADSFASDFQLIPVVANNPGQQGAVFATHVAIMNPTAKAFTVTATMWDGSGASFPGTISLAAGELKLFDNFVDAVFHKTGAGSVILTAPESAGGQHNNRFIVSAEVYTFNGVRYGTTVPVQEFAGTDSPSFAAGISVNIASRTNVGCFNQSASANSIRVDVYDGAGNKLGNVSMPLAGHAWGQAGIPQAVTGGYVVFNPSEPAVCYAVTVDNQTNDGRFIKAAEYLP